MFDRDTTRKEYPLAVGCGLDRHTRSLNVHLQEWNITEKDCKNEGASHGWEQVIIELRSMLEYAQFSTTCSKQITSRGNKLVCVHCMIDATPHTPIASSPK